LSFHFMAVKSLLNLMFTSPRFSFIFFPKPIAFPCGFAFTVCLLICKSSAKSRVQKGIVSVHCISHIFSPCSSIEADAHSMSLLCDKHHLLHLPQTNVTLTL
jgi:hypothetical protein